MRKKIKELLHKEEGFTLVELLAVIVILGLIVAIAVPAIGNTMDTAKSNTAAANEELIIDAARLYEVENTIGKTEEDGVTVDTLIKKGFLDLRASESEAIRNNKVWKNSDGGYSYSGASTE